MLNNVQTDNVCILLTILFICERLVSKEPEKKLLPQTATTQSEKKKSPKRRTCLQGRKEKRPIIPLRKVVEETEKAAESSIRTLRNMYRDFEKEK
jgi:hypothetical protein